MVWTRRSLLQTAAAISAGTAPGLWLREAEAAADGTLTVALSDNPPLTCDPHMSFVNPTPNQYRIIADDSPYVWIGFFNATNLWRDSVKNFKPSRGLTIKIRDSAVS